MKTAINILFGVLLVLDLYAAFCLKAGHQLIGAGLCLAVLSSNNIDNQKEEPGDEDN